MDELYLSESEAAQDIIHDLRNQFAIAKHAAGAWKKRADELDERCAEALEALRALFENTDEYGDFFYEYSHIGGKHWCKVCGESASDYVRVTHAADCLIGAAEAAIAKAQGE